jgi:uncharacterized protein (DUF779 family)
VSTPCGPATAFCYVAAAIRAEERHLPLGTVDGRPINAAQYEALGRSRLVLDAEPGTPAVSPSPPRPSGHHNLTFPHLTWSTP